MVDVQPRDLMDVHEEDVDASLRDTRDELVIGNSRTSSRGRTLVQVYAVNKVNGTCKGHSQGLWPSRQEADIGAQKRSVAECSFDKNSPSVARAS